MSAHEIIRIANELAAKGIPPSTAMVKARLSQPVPMAELLKVLSQWKQQSHPTEPPPASTPAATGTQADAVNLQQLSEQLNRLEQKVDRLTTLLLQRQPD
ncbi:DNA-binding protein [Aeromonas salmonicida]|uniref:DNA-binding protein n=1 Tax=Aeromonas salmonicida TaxID=645 RepID=UPI001F26F72F|nr:DNA-binding protein [Aeromonas salmonicida]MCE9932916.1 DNA-binding protein [Aeromonas salmonicida]